MDADEREAAKYKSMEVLIIEDEKPAARRLSRMLSELGVAVSHLLHTVEEAVEWFGEHQPRALA